MKLTQDEKEILNGRHGEDKKMLLNALVDYAEFIDAKNLVDVNAGKCQLTISLNNSTCEILKEYQSLQKITKLEFPDEKVKKQNSELVEKFNSLCYCKSLPKYGEVFCWSDSFQITYANSVLGARGNETPSLITMISSLIGKTPYFGLLKDENRVAGIVFKLDVKKDVNPQLLGKTIAKKCMGKIPYIFGLEKILKDDDFSKSFLKDFCAGFSSSTKLRLFHINNITAEAKKLKKQIIKNNAKTIEIDDDELERVKKDSENQVKKQKICIFGCPHLSLYQLVNITNEIGWELRQNKRKKLKMKTYFMIEKSVLEKFKNLPEFKELKQYGGIISCECPINLFKNKKNLITSSIKLSKCLKAKFFEEDELILLLCQRWKNGKSI